MSDGFKLSFDATDKNDIKVCQELSTLLIDKITKIEISVSSNDYD